MENRKLEKKRDKGVWNSLVLSDEFGLFFFGKDVNCERFKL